MSSDLEPNSNVNEDEIDEETKEKLRGDAIGNTMYSQRFVLQTLLKFSNLQWCQELEDDLCFLWDMTVEKDVCDFLVNHSFFSIACTSIATYKENRFLEIVIGILANILSVKHDLTLKEDEINVVISEMDTDDHLIIIQILRFVKALTYPSFSEQPFKINDDFVEKIIFILNNSINNDLIMICLQVVAQITSTSGYGVKFFNINVLESVLTAYLTFIYSENHLFDLETEYKQLNVQYFLEIIQNMLNEDNDNMDFIKQIKKSYTNVINKEIIRILTHLSVEENLIPITERFEFYLSAILYICENLNIDYTSEVMVNVCKIIYILKNNSITGDSYDSCVELLCFLIFKGKLTTIYTDLDALPLTIVKKCIENVPTDNVEYTFNYLSNYNSIQLKYNKK